MLFNNVIFSHCSLQLNFGYSVLQRPIFPFYFWESQDARLRLQRVKTGYEDFRGMTSVVLELIIRTSSNAFNILKGKGSKRARNIYVVLFQFQNHTTAP